MLGFEGAVWSGEGQTTAQMNALRTRTGSEFSALEMPGCWLSLCASHGALFLPYLRHWAGQGQPTTVSNNLSLRKQRFVVIVQPDLNLLRISGGR